MGNRAGRPQPPQRTGRHDILTPASGGSSEGRVRGGYLWKTCTRTCDLPAAAVIHRPVVHRPVGRVVHRPVVHRNCRGTCCSSAGRPATYRAPQRTCPHWPVSERRARAHRPNERLSQPASACEPHTLAARQALHLAASALPPAETSRLSSDGPSVKRKNNPEKKPFGIGGAPRVGLRVGLSPGRSAPIQTHSDSRRTTTRSHLEPAGVSANSRGAAPSRGARRLAVPLRHASPAVASADGDGSGRPGIVSIYEQIAPVAHCLAPQWPRRGPANSIFDHVVLSTFPVIAPTGPDACRSPVQRKPTVRRSPGDGASGRAGSKCVCAFFLGAGPRVRHRRLYRLPASSERSSARNPGEDARQRRVLPIRRLSALAAHVDLCSATAAREDGRVRNSFFLNKGGTGN